MATWPSDNPKEIVSIVSHFLVYPYTSVSVSCLLVYDYFVTFDREVEYIWRMQRSWGKIMFLINRYVPFTLVPIVLHGFFSESHPDRFRIHVLLSGAIIYASYVFSVVILLRRAYIAWERNTAVGYLIACVFLVSLAESAYSMHDFFAGVKVIPTPIPSIPCILVTLNDSVWTGMVNLLIMDIVALGLLLTKSYMHFRAIQSNLMETMIRDGIGYFVCNTCLTLTNLVIIKTADPFMNHSFTQVQCILQSVLCTRLLLHLHVITSASPDSPSITEFSTVRFTETFGTLRRRSYLPSYDANTPPDSPNSSAPLTRLPYRTTGSH